MINNPSGRFGEIPGDVVRNDLFFRQDLLRRNSVSGSDQYRVPAARVAGAFDILSTVPDHCAAREIDAEPLPGLKNHPRPRLSAVTAVLRQVRTVKNIRYLATAGSQGGPHHGMDMLEILYGNHLPADRRLVGDDNRGKPVYGEVLYRKNASGNKLEFGPAFDIIRRIVVDDTVPVQENNFFKQW